MISIQEFCERHDACKEGRDWAIENCESMQDAWNKLQPEWLIWVATRQGVLTDRELRLFACWSVRQVWHLLTDERSRNAVEVAERFAEGNATQDELTAASYAARAAWDARYAERAAWSAAWSAARAAWDAAWSAASYAAIDAARAAEWSAWAAEWSAWSARYAARDAQVEWLRQNTKPNFEVVTDES